MIFRVWDQLNSSEEHAAEVDDLEAEMAAEQYAEQDWDGHRDGIYQRGGHTLCVRDTEGKLWKFDVTLDWEPLASAREIT